MKTTLILMVALALPTVSHAQTAMRGQSFKIGNVVGQKIQLKSTPLTRAMARSWQKAAASAYQQPTVTVTTETVRLTAYSRTERGADRHSRAGRTATNVSLRPATESQIGVAAGHPDDLGKYVLVPQPSGRRPLVYFVADVGGALVSKAADTRGVGKVIDLYAPQGQRWGSYQTVQLVAPGGAGHYLLADWKDARRFLDWDVYNRILTQFAARRG